MAETELERAEKRYAQAKARLQALKNREAAKQRKLDTRRKVILGGALMDLAGRDDAAALMLDRLIRNLPREQDRKAFAGWSAERDATGTGEGDVWRPGSPAPPVGDAGTGTIG
ncbi:MAG: mobilization protein [Paracoccus sp.]|nr:mobilization protein [Paracoccus sp. (in: a-proteobacteria)]